MDGGTAIIKEIFIKAPPRVVFDILTNPVKIVRWMGSQTRLGPRRDGMWRLDLNGRKMVRGRCLKVRQDRILMFTWGYLKTRQRIAVIDSVVVISLRHRGNGTWVQLIHRNLPRVFVDYRSRPAGFQLLSRKFKSKHKPRRSPWHD